MTPKYFALIVGNSGSGKTTIAEELQKRLKLLKVIQPDLPVITGRLAILL